MVADKGIVRIVALADGGKTQPRRKIYRNIFHRCTAISRGFPALLVPIL